ncbi:MAG TPA: 30S ribosomal protein S24e [Thermoplasmata archaeon]|nr:30S ribosomal protein S24e [Thermoplasmata archaeon]HIH98472.1 30S ribosomal protein S24e [Thermoplasmata archaeon]
MKLELIEKKENKLLDRLEVRFRITDCGPTPKRGEVREKIAAKLGVKSDGIILDYLSSGYGEQAIMGYAKVYKSLEAADKIESGYLIKRNASQTQKEEKKVDAE